MIRIDGGVLPHLFCFVFYVLVSGQPVYAKDVFLHLSAFLFMTESALCFAFGL